MYESFRSNIQLMENDRCLLLFGIWTEDYILLAALQVKYSGMCIEDVQER